MVKKHTSKTAIRVTRNATGADGMSMRKPWRGYASGGSVWEKLADTWPAKAAKEAWDAARLPGDVATGRFATSSTSPGQWSDEDEARAQINQSNIYNRSASAAGQIPGGAAFSAPASAVSPVLVGPFGALMLRNAERELGKPPTVHPVIGQEIADRTVGIRPELRDAVKGALVDNKDELSRALMSIRGNNESRDLFKTSGWSRGSEGLARKEIADIGAKIVERDGKYFLDHPAGDFHKIYDLPPIQFDRKMPVGNASFDPFTRQIVVGGEANKTNLKKGVNPALHELQHAIQEAEGFAKGSNPLAEIVSGKQISKSLGREVPKEERMQNVILSQLFGFDKDASSLNKAAMDAYLRRAGETESNNVMKRRAKSYRYMRHPEFTEDYGRGVQIVDDVMKELPKKASGGQLGNPPWYTRNEARGMSGMLKSPVPGRNDQIPLKVKGGSYVLPADIPSALGQGNTMAGGTILDKMFNKGPYGMNLPRARAGSSTRMTRKSSLSRTFADGGDVGESDIIAAGGEYILSPEQVYMVGGGDLDAGHKILDAFVKQVRSQHIKTLQKLPGPKKD